MEKKSLIDYKLLMVLGLFTLFLSSCKPGSNSNGENGNSGFGGPGAPPTDGSVTDLKLSCEEARFVYLLNIYRTQNGRNALNVSKNAVISSRWHGQDMINKNYFDHTEPSGRTFSQRAAAYGYYAWAENIAGGNTDAAGTFCQWKNSSGHNQNMLGSHESLGIGRAIGGNYGAYWPNNFGPAAADYLQLPLTIETNCTMPTTLPGC